MKTLYVTDLDGTLLDKKACLTERSEKIIKELIGRGMLFSIATARSQSASKFLKQLNLNIPSIHLNGVLMYDNQRQGYVDCVSMENASALEVIRILRYFDRMPFVYKFNRDCDINVEFERLSNETEKNFFELRKKDYKSFLQTPVITVTDEDRVIYFTMIDEYDRLLPICQEVRKVPGINATLYSDNYSHMFFLEIFSSSASKAAGVLKLKEMLGADRLVTFGDNLNDLEMLSISDFGIAVKDAVDEVREQADLVIGNSYEDGVALSLRSMFSGS